MPQELREKTVVGEKFSDDTYEYRLVTLSRADYNRLPEDYRRYYEPDNAERLETERAYLQRQDEMLEAR